MINKPLIDKAVVDEATKKLIDSLKQTCGSYGLGNDGNEYKTIPQSFTINVSDKKNATDYSESMNKLNGINFTISGICLIIAALLGLFSLKKIKGKKGV